MPMNPNPIEIDPGDGRNLYWDVENDTIVSAVWTSQAISPAGTPALTIGAPVNTSTRTMAKVSGIVLAAKHELTTSITLASGQVIQRSRILVGVNL